MFLTSTRLVTTTTTTTAALVVMLVEEAQRRRPGDGAEHGAPELSQLRVQLDVRLDLLRVGSRLLELISDVALENNAPARGRAPREAFDVRALELGHLRPNPCPPLQELRVGAFDTRAHLFAYLFDIRVDVERWPTARMSGVEMQKRPVVSAAERKPVEPDVNGADLILESDYPRDQLAQRVNRKMLDLVDGALIEFRCRVRTAETDEAGWQLEAR